MLPLDGAMGEGGGQLVRSAVALAAVTGRAVTIDRIREKRKEPGLAAQHVAAVEAVAGTCQAECDGLVRGSRRLTFEPGPMAAADLRVDVGTAGSIPLVIQCWLPAAIHTGGSLTVTGGTEVAMSPTIDYLDRVFVPVLRAAGAEMEIDIRARGYYPRGGGEVRVRVDQSRLRPISCPPERDAGIISCSQNLPGHVSRRQAEAARDAVRQATGTTFPVHIDCREGGPSTGSSVTAWIGCFGGVAIGRRGYPAGDVGRDAARRLLKMQAGGGTVDVHLADQLLVYLARYGGTCTAGSLTTHAATVCDLLELFDMPVSVEGVGPVIFSA